MSKVLFLTRPSDIIDVLQKEFNFEDIVRIDLLKDPRKDFDIKEFLDQEKISSEIFNLYFCMYITVDKVHLAFIHMDLKEQVLELLNKTFKKEN